MLTEQPVSLPALRKKHWDGYCIAIFSLNNISEYDLSPALTWNKLTIAWKTSLKKPETRFADTCGTPGSKSSQIFDVPMLLEEGRSVVLIAKNPGGLWQGCKGMCRPGTCQCPAGKHEDVDQCLSSAEQQSVICKCHHQDRVWPVVASAPGAGGHIKFWKCQHGPLDSCQTKGLVGSRRVIGQRPQWVRVTTSRQLSSLQCKDSIRSCGEILS